jgi:hypothetical protein
MNHDLQRGPGIFPIAVRAGWTLEIRAPVLRH